MDRATKAIVWAASTVVIASGAIYIVNQSNLIRREILVSQKVGNACPQSPLQMAYEGEGTCKAVRCEESLLGFLNLSGNHHSQLRGKNWRCNNNGRLNWGLKRATAFYDSNCPEGEPKIGWSNTCAHNEKEDSLGIDIVTTKCKVNFGCGDGERPSNR